MTVALVLDGAIDPVYFGTSCAARALRTGAKDVRAAARAADDERRAEAEHARREAARVADAAWQAFLDARAPTHGSASRWPDRFLQIEELGGYAAARAAFVEAGGRGVMSAVELAVGDEAFVFVWREIGRRGTRQQLDGVARVRVVELVAGGARVRVEVVQAGRGALPGQVLERDRGAVYAARSRSERATFRELVSRYWGGA